MALLHAAVAALEAHDAGDGLAAAGDTGVHAEVARIAIALVPARCSFCLIAHLVAQALTCAAIVDRDARPHLLGELRQNLLRLSGPSGSMN